MALQTKGVRITSISFQPEILTRFDSQIGTANRSAAINKVLEHVLSSETYVPSIVRSIQKEPKQ